MTNARLGPKARRLGIFGIALAVVLGAVGAGVSAQAQSSNYRLPRDCYLSFARTKIPNLDGFDAARDAGRLRDIASTCGGVRPQDGLAYAYFYAAKANRILGEGPLQPLGARPDVADPARLVEAARLFEVAAGMSSATGGDPNLLLASRIELARVYRLQGRRDAERYNDARRLLGEIADTRFGQLDRATLYERAMIVIEQDRPGPDDDGALLPALQDLQVFANRDASQYPDLYVIHRGPIALAQLATRLGNQVLQRPPSLDNTQAALRLFNDAVRAYEVLQATGGAPGGAASAETNINLGMLNLRLANLLGTSPTSRFDCSAGAEPRAIDAAERAFAEALRADPNAVDAHWGRGCALAARGNYASAETAFQSAISNLPPPQQAQTLQRRRSEYYFALARVQAEQRKWDGPNGALANFETAHSLERDPSAAVAILLQTAQAYLRAGRATDAQRALDRAIGYNLDTAPALMLRGELLLCGASGDFESSDEPCQGAGAVNASAAARRDLIAARAITGGHQPRANYLLSRLEEQAGDGPSAVRYATEAYLSDRSNSDYRRQACLTRIRYGRVRGPDQAQSACLADASADAEALFYEGVFWLREAYVSSGGNQRNFWGQAIRSFERGEAAPGSQRQLNDGAWNLPLTDALTYGRRYALHCAGLEAANPEAPGDASSNEPRELFRERYGLGRCWR